MMATLFEQECQLSRTAVYCDRISRVQFYFADRIIGFNYTNNCTIQTSWATNLRYCSDLRKLPRFKKKLDVSTKKAENYISQKTRFLHNNLQVSILSMEQLFYDVDFLVYVCVFCVPRHFPFIRHNCLLTLLIIIEKYFYWPYIVYCHCVWNGCGC